MIKIKLYLCFSCLGLAAFPLPAMSQVPVATPVATPGASSITGVATYTSGASGYTSTIAAQATFPSSVYATTAAADVTTTGSIGADDLFLSNITVGTIDPTTDIVVITAPVTVESVAAGQLAGAANLNEQVSLIRAWRSGGID